MIKWHKPPLMEVLYYGFCPSKAEWDENAALVLKRTHRDLEQYPSSSGNMICWRDELGNARLLVTIHEDNDRDPLKLVGVIAHESVHVAQMIFQEAAEESPGMEAEAYMIENVVKTIWADYVSARGNPPPL